MGMRGFLTLDYIRSGTKAGYKGFIGAIELAKDKETRTPYPSEVDVGYICREFCFNNGLVMRSSGDTMLLSPPLIITKEHVDEIVTRARNCLDLTAEAVGHKG